MGHKESNQTNTYTSYNLMVSEKILLCFSQYKSMGVIDSQSVASLDSRSLIGRIYVVEHYMLLHTKIYGFREDF